MLNTSRGQAQDKHTRKKRHAEGCAHNQQRRGERTLHGIKQRHKKSEGGCDTSVGVSTERNGRLFFFVALPVLPAITQNNTDNGKHMKRFIGKWSHLMSFLGGRPPAFAMRPRMSAFFSTCQSLHQWVSAHAVRGYRGLRQPSSNCRGTEKGEVLFFGDRFTSRRSGPASTASLWRVGAATGSHARNSLGT